MPWRLRSPRSRQAGNASHFSAGSYKTAEAVLPDKEDLGQSHRSYGRVTVEQRGSLAINGRVKRGGPDN